jgi:HAD superfamily hydrolase (TIGR01509 family)
LLKIQVVTKLFKVVIFDWDGTLVDSTQVILASFHKALSDVDADVSDEFLARRIGIGTRLMIIDALKENDVTFDEEYVEQLINKKLGYQIEHSDQAPLFEGAVKLLDVLKGKVNMAVATMTNRVIIDRMLRDRSLTKYFDFVISADAVEKPKPNPEIFLKTAQQLEVKPGDCVVIEDSIFGVEAAKKAGMNCIVTPTGFYSKMELAKKNPDLTADNLKDKRILNFIFQK